MGKLRTVFIGILAVILLAGLSFAVWANMPLGPMPEAEAALQSDASVQVERSSWIEFVPVGVQPKTAFIFYPGGRVDPRSYAPAARQIAAEGYLVAVMPMPLNLAVFDQDRALRVIQAHPEITNWAIGGHSLGGAMAASFIGQRPDMVSGLVLWAAYPPESTDLSALKLWVVSVYGSQDSVLSTDQLEETRLLLPRSTRWVQIAGGNHAQFGWYGDQPGDAPASISRQQQQDAVVTATVELLQLIESSASH